MMDQAPRNETKDESDPDLNTPGFKPSGLKSSVLPLDQAHHAPSCRKYGHIFAELLGHFRVTFQGNRLLEWWDSSKTFPCIVYS